MSKNKVSEWSTTAASNTDISGIDIAEGCAPSGINNAIREVMAQIKDMQTGADGDNFVVGGTLSVTGTSAFTGAITATGGVVGNLTGNASTATSAASATTATTATKATNIAGGGAGQVPYNSGADTTAFLAAGTSGQFLQSNGTSAPSWASATIPGDFTGSNQSLTTNGYQKLPGGLIIQWGTASNVSANSTLTVTLPIANPTATLQAYATISSITSNQSSNQNASTGADVLSASQIYVRNGLNAAQTLRWFAIGY